MSPATALTRRSALGLVCKHCFGLAGLTALPGQMAQAAQTEDVLLPPRFKRPELETDEGGLWGLMDREEARLRHSPFLLKDFHLSYYVRELLCDLVGEHCLDVRVHVVRTPVFNATMAPNGMMQIWTGLLLRLENEAQLAAVLGHEMAHYLERHSLEQLRSAKSRAAFAQFMGLFGAAGAIGQLGVFAGGFAFSREHEIRADRLGMRLVQRAGYEGQQAARVWENLISELKVRGGEDAGTRSPMMATHPPVASRRDDLLKLAGNKLGHLASEPYVQAISPYRLDWLFDEIRRGQFEESLVLFNRFLKNDPADVQALYARGEVYRLRAAGPDDLQHAFDDLVRASSLRRAPAQVFRSLGFVYQQRGQGPEASSSFAKYLALVPGAVDADLIRSYITPTPANLNSTVDR